MKYFPFLLLSLTILLVATPTHGTHLRCGQIVVEQLESGGKTVRIKIQMWLNTINTDVQFGGEDEWLDFGDGTHMLVPETESVLRPDLGAGVAFAEFTVDHTYAQMGAYTVSYSEPNRNAGIINIDGAVNTRLYLESRFTLFQDRRYQTPSPLLEPFFRGAAGRDFSVSLAATDANDLLLLYSLHTPLREKATPVVNFRSPASLTLGPVTGLLSWDGTLHDQPLAGEFLFALRIRQIDDEDEWKEVGYMYRDIQVLLSNSEDASGRIADNTKREEVIVVPEHTSTTVRVFAYPAEDEIVTFSVATSLPQDNYAFATYDSLSDDQEIVVGKITVEATPAMTRSIPYVFSIRTKFTTSADDWHARDVSYAFSTAAFDIPVEEPPITSVGSEMALTVTPNPFRDFIRVNSSNEAPRQLGIYSVTGQQIMHVSDPSGDVFHLPQLPAGMYLLKCTLPDGRILFSRIVKE